jgi:hypothetical protein
MGHPTCYSFIIKDFRREQSMKGYVISSGFMGFVDGAYMLFASEEDYYEYVQNQ